ncbi:conserved hypothetical protein [Histoplasma capsulatum G186AR]|uniref:T6SS Phospholipase effector Tle1-like catalytic domain-containing protein n=1 Tax=Ajellomyces capsulatus (strain G186AR / H82 / ATCC MYA-2454 / RMSCC 2432) TaxID=447093 RepID=C0NTY3_AJECG|nr:uncharacterized protein HCBG_06613 [Histoplasma capsulatum G186AR]EEH05494.1 conserved hypothetical protein [Histoplasma capsulatum G186AR]
MIPFSTNRENRSDVPRRLVLCFDGTGNSFQANESDTNVVKIYDMLNRFDKNQFHYYQPGIGTFDAGTSNSGISFIGRLRASIGSMMDQAIGTTFEYHVSAGYKFLMRFYSPGDAIYIFGFSRGAYTARFLAEMINVIGLLSQGNEDMIRFAFQSFSEVQRNRGKINKSTKERDQERYLEHFKRTFCRRDVKPPAVHIRHAVSIHERRLKFKPALFLFEKDHQDSDIHEVWFAGNHCDVGGGFHYEGPGKHLLSDIPLAWMIDQVNALGDQPAGKLAFDQETINQRGHMKAGRAPVLLPTHGLSSHTPRESALKERRPHDFLAFDRGVTRFATLMWWILEILPLFTRLELEYGEWIPRYWPPNLGATRDIPRDAKIHCSVVQLYKAGVLSEMPRLGGDLPPFLEDPILLIKSLPFMLLRILMPWYWASRWGKQKKIPPKTQEAIKKKITKVVESHGARSWSWTY